MNQASALSAGHFVDLYTAMATNQSGRLLNLPGELPTAIYKLIMPRRRIVLFLQEPDLDRYRPGHLQWLSRMMASMSPSSEGTETCTKFRPAVSAIVSFDRDNARMGVLMNAFRDHLHHDEADCVVSAQYLSGTRSLLGVEPSFCVLFDFSQLARTCILR